MIKLHSRIQLVNGSSSVSIPVYGLAQYTGTYVYVYVHGSELTVVMSLIHRHKLYGLICPIAFSFSSSPHLAFVFFARFFATSVRSPKKTASSPRQLVVEPLLKVGEPTPLGVSLGDAIDPPKSLCPGLISQI